MILNDEKLLKETPRVYKLLMSEKVKKEFGNLTHQTLYDFFDSNGVRVFIGYGASGGFVPTVYRKHTH